MKKLFHIKSLKWTNCEDTNRGGETIYWGPNNCGYTKDIYQAGIYTEEQIEKHKKNHGVGLTTEVIEIETESWDIDRIVAWERYIEAETEDIRNYKKDLIEHEREIKKLKTYIESSQHSKNKMEHELKIQEMLRG